jgi:hypothetical protein
MRQFARLCAYLGLGTGMALRWTQEKSSLLRIHKTAHLGEKTFSQKEGEDSDVRIRTTFF